MIIKEFYRIREDGVNLYCTFSDESLRIRKVGTDEIYDEAVDIENASCEYQETDMKVNKEEGV